MLLLILSQIVKNTHYSHTSDILTITCQLLIVTSHHVAVNVLRWHIGPNVLKVCILTSQVASFSMILSPPPHRFWIKPVHSHHILTVTDTKKWHRHVIINTVTIRHREGDWRKYCCLTKVPDSSLPIWVQSLGVWGWWWHCWLYISVYSFIYLTIKLLL